MAEQQPSRLEHLFELGGLGMKLLIREPVRESVREALVDERIMAEDRVVRPHRRTDTEETGDTNRLLRPMILLPILALLAVGVIVRRRNLMKFADEKDVIDRGATDGSDSTESGNSTFHESHDRDADRAEPTDRRDGDVDTDSEELSTTE